MKKVLIVMIMIAGGKKFVKENFVKKEQVKKWLRV